MHSSLVAPSSVQSLRFIHQRSMKAPRRPRFQSFSRLKQVEYFDRTRSFHRPANRPPARNRKGAASNRTRLDIAQKGLTLLTGHGTSRIMK